MPELSRWDFKDEIMKMAESCIGNKKETARRKAKALFDKYRPIISTSVDDNIWYMDNFKKFERVSRCLKTGVIDYDGGALKISEVEFYKETSTNIIVNMKSGETLNLSKDFRFIHEIFK